MEYHKHTGIDQPRIDPKDLLGFPIFNQIPTHKAEEGTMVLVKIAGEYSLYAKIDKTWISMGSTSVDANGNVVIDGKLTVTGVIDPTAVILSDPGNAAYFESGPGQSAAVSPAGSGRIRYNATTNKWQVSGNGGSYADLATGGSAFITAISDTATIDLTVFGSTLSADLNPSTSGTILIGQGASTPTWNAMSGDITITNAGVTTIGALKVATGMVQANAITYAKLQQGSARTMLANNTAGAANFAEHPYYDVPMQTYAGTIIWNGTPPTTIVSQQYAWSCQGDTVFLTLTVVYTNAGATNTVVIFTLPSDCPTPATIAGVGANASEVMYMGVARIEGTVTTNPGAARCFIAKNAGNNGYNISVVAASNSAKVASFSIQYRVS